MEECEWKDLFFSGKFGISLPCSARYLLEVGARISLKVATKFFLEVKKPKNLDF